MKLGLVLLMGLMVLVSCTTTRPASVGDAPALTVAEDSTEYELLVMDARFETYLATQPFPKWYYSDSYYQQWNVRYCTEWNIRHQNPMRYGDFYQTNIPYDPSLDYGIDFNFRLYHYFQFIEKEYSIVLVRRRS